MYKIIVKIDLRIDAAAEYFFDDYFINLLDTNQPLLTFSGSRYVLFETPALNKPIKLEDIIREIQNKDIFPVLAHPERYAWLNGNWDKVKALFDTGVLFQVNVMSLTGLYDGAAKRMAERLIDNQMLHFLGSDCHKLAHTATYLEAMKTKHYRKALDQDLLNRSI